MSITAAEQLSLPVQADRQPNNRVLDSVNKVRRFAELAVAHWERDRSSYTITLANETERELPNLAKAMVLLCTLNSMDCKAGLLNMEGVIFSPQDTAVFVDYAKEYSTLVAAGSESPESDEEYLSKISSALPDLTVITTGKTTVTVHSLSPAHIEQFPPSDVLREMIAA